MKNVEVKTDKKFLKRMLALAVCGFAMCASFTPAYAADAETDGNGTQEDGTQSNGNGDKDDNGGETVVTKDPEVKVTGDAISAEQGKEMADTVKNNKKVTFDLSKVKEKVVPSDVFAAAKDAGTQVVFQLDGYTISFDGKSITDPSIKVNVNATVGAEETKALKEQLVGKNLVVSFDHSGKLPGKATVTVSAGDKFKAGDKVYLYYINKDGVVEYQKQEITVDKDGNITFTIDHCSDYVLSNVAPADVKEATTDETKKDNGNGIVETGVGLVENGIAFASLAGCGAVLGLAVLKKKKA